MNLEGIKIDVRVFQLDRSHYEIKDKSFDETLEIIKANHQKLLNSKFEDLTNVKPNLVKKSDEEFEYASYCFNQPKDQNYWKLFLPQEIIEKQNFEIVEFSYVLFIKFQKHIYCVIGGGGISVIKKYINTTFGIGVYQHFAKPTEDIVIEMNSRGIASNISQKKHTYNLNQTISETLEYSEIPTKIKIVLREEIKKTIFKKYKFDSDRALVEVGSYFNLKKTIDFNELKNLIKDLYDLQTNHEYTQLTLFHKVDGIEQINDLDNTLQEKIIDDIIAHGTSSEIDKKQEDIIEIVHPFKLEKFYECNRFEIKAKYSRGKDDEEVHDRARLYFICTKHIYNRLDDVTDRFSIKGELYKLNIVGFVNEKDLTHGHFYSHVVAEIDLNSKKYFRIDGNWYYLKDEFLKLMTQDAKDYYQKYKLDKSILNLWPDGFDEDQYNLSHKKNNSFVLDKRFRDNIELCDILIEKEQKLYFIHVKDGFNTNLRDCYIQLILAAKRLSVDIKDNNGKNYLKLTLEYYNSFNPDNLININSLLSRLAKRELEIVFVMAYRNLAYPNQTDIEKIERSQSNIAKYCIVQVIKEMQSYFDIKLLDISNVK